MLAYSRVENLEDNFHFFLASCVSKMIPRFGFMFPLMTRTFCLEMDRRKEVDVHFITGIRGNVARDDFYAGVANE